MKKAAKEQERRKRRKTSPRYLRAIKWTVLLGIVALVAYVVSQTAGVAYDDRAIGVVDFSSLTPSAKRSALQAANLARCGCGCGLTLAQCVATDNTCPIREGNIERIRTIVRDATDRK